jgi:hypothetical protein
VKTPYHTVAICCSIYTQFSHARKDKRRNKCSHAADFQSAYREKTRTHKKNLKIIDNPLCIIEYFPCIFYFNFTTFPQLSFPNCAISS